MGLSTGMPEAVAVDPESIGKAPAGAVSASHAEVLGLLMARFSLPWPASASLSQISDRALNRNWVFPHMARGNKCKLPSALPQRTYMGPYM